MWLHCVHYPKTHPITHTFNCVMASFCQVCFQLPAVNISHVECLMSLVV